MISLKRYAPFFSMVWLSFLRSLPLGRLSIIIPKASTIRLRNSSVPTGFPLKITELLNYFTNFDHCFCYLNFGGSGGVYATIFDSEITSFARESRL